MICLDRFRLMAMIHVPCLAERVVLRPKTERRTLRPAPRPTEPAVHGRVTPRCCSEQMSCKPTTSKQLKYSSRGLPLACVRYQNTPPSTKNSCWGDLLCALVLANYYFATASLHFPTSHGAKQPNTLHLPNSQ